MVQTTILHATKKDLEDKKQFTLRDLTSFLKSKKFRYTGTKAEVIKRVLWVCRPNNYPKPHNIELKPRGRPKKTQNNNSEQSTYSNPSEPSELVEPSELSELSEPSKLNHYSNVINTNKQTIEKYQDATCKQDLKRLKSAALKHILNSHNLRTIGKLDELVDRVWWLLHKDTMEKPAGIEKKQRGRPSFKKHYIVEFIDDTSVDSDHSSYDDDDGDYNQNIWSALFINNNIVNHLGKGKRYFKFKQTNYLFKETIDNDFIIHGTLDEQGNVTLIELINFKDYPEEIQHIIQDVCDCM